MNSTPFHSEIINKEAERIGYDETERQQILHEALRDWVANDAIFSLLEQPPSREAETEAFLDDPDSSVIPKYGTYKITNQLLENRHQLAEALEDLRDGLFTSIEQDNPYFIALEMRINEVKYKTQYLRLSIEHQKAVKDGDMALAEETGEAIMELGKKLYGEVAPETFDSIVAYARMNVNQSDMTDIPFGEEIRDEFLDLIPETGLYEPIELSGEFFDEMREIIYERMGEYLEIIDSTPPVNGETYSSQERSHICDLVLDRLRTNGYEHEFEVVVYDELTTEGIRQREQLVAVAGNRINGEPTPQEFKALIAHELLRHVFTRVAGENSSVPMLGLGLPGYDFIEEGEAKLPEQVINGEYYESGVNYILADGLSKGIRTEKMNKDGVFEILWRKIYLYTEPHSSEIYSAARGNIRLSKKLAEQTVKRIFRIGTGETPGVHYQKDPPSYNNRHIWEYYRDVFEKHGGKGLREAYDRNRRGKYNYFDDSQVALVENMEMLS